MAIRVKSRESSFGISAVKAKIVLDVACLVSTVPRAVYQIYWSDGTPGCIVSISVPHSYDSTRIDTNASLLLHSAKLGDKQNPISRAYTVHQSDHSL
jgi:hypothetical protein